jgi:hypothetical protein
MANISVIENLTDPDFVDPCTVLRRVETVGTDGIGYHAITPIQIFASIQAAEGDVLSMGDGHASMTQGTYECITIFPLNEATETTAADEVLWQGMEFTVISVSRFGNFANSNGHYEAVMHLKPLRTRSQPQTTWVDNSLPTTWVDNGLPVFWDVPGAQGVPATTQWLDGTVEATWQDGISNTLWDVEPEQ